jgi:hypothetical protein
VARTYRGPRYDFEAYWEKKHHFEGLPGPAIVREITEDFHGDKAAIAAFGTFFVKKGLKQGWFEAEFGISDAEAKRGLEEGWLLPEIGLV